MQRHFTQNSLAKVFTQNSLDFPDRPAISCRSQLYTYEDTWRLARNVSLIIHDNFRDENRVGIVTGDDIYTYSSILGILLSGCAYVPLNLHHPDSRNDEICAQARLNLVLTSQLEIGEIKIRQINNSEVRFIGVRNSGKYLGSISHVAEISENEIAYLFFTSGSTGKPKGVPIYHRNVNGFLEAIFNSSIYQFTKEDKFIQMFELTFDLSVFSFFVPLMYGACTYVVPDDGIKYMNIISLLEEESITVALMVPSVIGYLRKYFKEISLPNLRYSLFCGEALFQDIVEEWSECVPNAKIQNVYGPTEATIFCLYYDWTKNSKGEAINGIVPIGKALPGTIIQIRNEDGIFNNNQKGELCLAGVQVTDSYWRDEIKTNTAFIENGNSVSGNKIYRTGDAAYINENSNLIFCGRIDNQVKIDGYRVEPGEIEHHARNMAGGTESIVVPVPNETGVFELNLCLKNYSGETKTLIENLRTKLPSYMIPSKVYSFVEFPLNLNGKVDRKQIVDMIIKER